MRSKIAHWCVATTLLALTAIPALAAGRGYLGVTTQSTTEELKRGLDLSSDGLLVNDVSDGSPADRAGMKKGDVILTYNWKAVSSPEALRQLVRDSDPGKSVSIGLWRDGAKVTLQATLAELPSSENDDDYDTPMPPEAPRAPRAPRPPHGESGHTHRRVIIDGRELPDDEIDRHMQDLPRDLEGMIKMKGMRGWSGSGGPMMFSQNSNRGRLGVRIEKLNSDLGQALGMNGNSGVLVTEVFEDSPAQKAGLRAGDVIVKVGADSVDTPGELARAVDRNEGKTSLTVLRKGAKREVQADLGDREDTHTYWRSGGDGEDDFRNLEPGPGPRVYRWNTKDDGGDEADLREEMRQLKQELSDLREQMAKDAPKDDKQTTKPPAKQPVKK